MGAQPYHLRGRPIHSRCGHRQLKVGVGEAPQLNEVSFRQLAGQRNCILFKVIRLQRALAAWPVILTSGFMRGSVRISIIFVRISNGFGGVKGAALRCS